LGSNCKFTACLLESVYISNLKTISFRGGQFVVSRDGCTFGFVAYFCHAVPIALHKKKHSYETKKEKIVFIPTVWFIVTDPANNDINHIDVFKRCTYALTKYEN